jgi:hypothetical protein
MGGIKNVVNTTICKLAIVESKLPNPNNFKIQSKYPDKKKPLQARAKEETPASKRFSTTCQQGEINNPILERRFQA